MSCGVECDSASVVCFGPCAFMAELGRVPGSHRAPHPGPCSVGHEGEPGNDSGLQTLHCCECAHVKTHTQANSSCNPDTHTQRPLTKKRVRRKWDVFTTWLNLIVSKLIVRVTKTTTSLRIIFLPFCITGFLSSCETPHRPVKTTAADQLGGQYPAGQNKDSPTDLRPCNSADTMIKYS